MEKRNSSLNTDSQWSKQEPCFACATRVWLAVNHNTSITSGEWVRCSKRITRASKLGSCQSDVCNSWGYEWLQKSKDSLKDCFENVNIQEWICISLTYQVNISINDFKNHFWLSLFQIICRYFYYYYLIQEMPFEEKVYGQCRRQDHNGLFVSTSCSDGLTMHKNLTSTQIPIIIKWDENFHEFLISNVICIIEST